MNMQPDIEKLKLCIDELAKAMGMKILTEDLCLKLISHVLYDEEYDGVEGKNGWACFEKRLITEREIRNLLMAHSATKISRFNRIKEPDCRAFSTEEICNSFEYGLFGRKAKLISDDVLDPWERNA